MRDLRGTREMLRGHERLGLAGATHMAVAYLLALLIFPKPVAVVAMLFVGGRFRVERVTTTSLRADIAEGLRFLWRHRLLRTLALMVGGTILLGVVGSFIGGFLGYLIFGKDLDEGACWCSTRSGPAPRWGSPSPRTGCS